MSRNGPRNQQGSHENPEAPVDAIHQPRWLAEFARPVADKLVAELTPRCERIAIAGSLRRGKPDVSDIELLYVPRVGQVRRPGELFPKPSSLADELIDKWLADGMLEKRLNKNGITAWGTWNKLAIHAPSRLPVDLFATTAARWFVSLVVRTGSIETIVRLASNAPQRGFRLQVYGAIERTSTGEQISPKSEQEVFELCGAPYLNPNER
jgi:DNA polymerase/3'-5' exonuclease PolX